MSGMDAIDEDVTAFFAKAEARDPILGAAVGFVPAASRGRFRAWVALLSELRECAFELSDPRVTAAKAGWWAEELDGMARGAARHPLSRRLAREGLRWRGVSDTLLEVAADLDPAGDLEGAIAALSPLARALVAVEDPLFGAAGDGEGAERRARALALHWLHHRLAQGLASSDHARVPLALFARHGLRRGQLADPEAAALRRDWAATLRQALPADAIHWPYPRALLLGSDRRALGLLAEGRAPVRGRFDAVGDVWRAWSIARNAALQGHGPASPRT